MEMDVKLLPMAMFAITKVTHQRVPNLVIVFLTLLRQ